MACYMTLPVCDYACSKHGWLFILPTEEPKPLPLEHLFKASSFTAAILCYFVPFTTNHFLLFYYAPDPSSLSLRDGVALQVPPQNSCWTTALEGHWIPTSSWAKWFLWCCRVALGLFYLSTSIPLSPQWDLNQLTVAKYKYNRNNQTNKTICIGWLWSELWFLQGQMLQAVG